MIASTANLHLANQATDDAYTSATKLANSLAETLYRDILNHVNFNSTSDGFVSMQRLLEMNEAISLINRASAILNLQG